MVEVQRTATHVLGRVLSGRSLDAELRAATTRQTDWTPQQRAALQDIAYGTLRFLGELAAYYFAPIGEVLRLSLPAIERGKARALEAEGALPSALARTKQVGGRVVQVVRPTSAVETAGSLRGQAGKLVSWDHGRTMTIHSPNSKTT